jgi:hypothetical protein
MTVSKRTSDENLQPGIKRARTGKNLAPPPVAADHDQHKSFLDNTTTGFGGGPSLRQLINPQAAKLYDMVRVSAVAFHYLL